MVAQVDEQHAAVVALAVDPARQADGLADVGGAQLGAIMGAIGVHVDLLLAEDDDEAEIAAPRFTGAKPLCQPASSAAIAAADSCKFIPLITKSDDLGPLVERLSKQPFVAVDTEFMRENTYWPDLCLIQVASAEEAAAIDPKAEGIDLKPLLDLFVDNEDVLKVFHAGGQDLEIIHNLTGKVPHPLFDTQIAAMALGHGEQIGYSNLIEIAARPQPRQGRALHRLEPPAARQAPDRLCDRRRHPSRDDLPAHGREAAARPAAAPGSTRRWSGSPTRRASPSRPRMPGSGSSCRAATRRCSAA